MKKYSGEKRDISIPVYQNLPEINQPSKPTNLPSHYPRAQHYSDIAFTLLGGLGFTGWAMYLKYVERGEPFLANPTSEIALFAGTLIVGSICGAVVSQMLGAAGSDYD